MNSPFAIPLQATVRDANGNPLAEITVLFTLSANATFTGGTTGMARRTRLGVARVGGFPTQCVNAMSQLVIAIVTAGLTAGAAVSEVSVTGT